MLLNGLFINISGSYLGSIKNKFLNINFIIFILKSQIYKLSLIVRIDYVIINNKVANIIAISRIQIVTILLISI